MPATRYAIYYVPAADTPLYRFGASVLGYDSYAGADCDVIEGANARIWPARVREPRVYGFHATMKPPFRLAEGVDEADLQRTFLAFAAQHQSVAAGDIAVRELGSFIALTPTSPRPPLNALADACVRDFDRLRAPMTEQDLRRRLTPGLSDRHIEYIYRWGYPHVFEDFRFHMTLTGSLQTAKRTAALRFLCEKFGQLPDAQSLIVDRLVIARQNAPGEPFKVMQEAALAEQQ